MRLNTVLYLVSDRTGISEDVFLDKIESALAGGVTLIQLREKNAPVGEIIKLADKVKRVAHRYGIPLIIDDRVDIAMACGADGVHLGHDDMPIDIARRLLGRDVIIGATAKTVEQAVLAEEAGADYLGVGAIYPTTTKVKTVITEVAVLNDICSYVNIPVVAIGGLNAGNIDILRDSPIRGIAVVSAIMKSGDCKTSAAELRELLRDGWNLG